MKVNFSANLIGCVLIPIILQKKYPEPLVTLKVNKNDDFGTEKNALKWLIKLSSKWIPACVSLSGSHADRAQGPDIAVPFGLVGSTESGFMSIREH